MKFFSSFPNILFWLMILVGVIFLFTIPSPEKITKFRRLTHEIFPELKYPFTLPDLKFTYSGLEPYMDEQTVTIHYTKHHQAYVDNLNKGLEKYPEWQHYSLENLLANLNGLPVELSKVIKSHGGGHFNHTLFWSLLCKKDLNAGPFGIVFEKINKEFGSAENLKQEISKQALSIIGSGWVWLCADDYGDLKLVATYNHETPDLQKLHPILVLDVWEHAYYLKYKNMRADFVSAWWNLINWKQVETFYNMSLYEK
jgi:Fe-Mn family superoxide dismutase